MVNPTSQDSTGPNLEPSIRANFFQGKHHKATLEGALNDNNFRQQLIDRINTITSTETTNQGDRNFITIKDGKSRLGKLGAKISSFIATCERMHDGRIIDTASFKKIIPFLKEIINDEEGRSAIIKILSAKDKNNVPLIANRAHFKMALPLLKQLSESDNLYGGKVWLDFKNQSQTHT
ncbi:MAG: hypothetical protein WCF65_05285 [Parachlamydiaceae bacterium]